MKTITIMENSILEVQFKFPFNDKKSFMNMLKKIKSLPKKEREFNSLDKIWEIKNTKEKITIFCTNKVVILKTFNQSKAKIGILK